MSANTFLRSLLLIFTAVCCLPYSVYASDDFRQRINQEDSESAFQEDDVKAEIEFGRVLAARILGKYPSYDNDKLNEYVNKVGKGLAQFSNRPEIEFRFAVIDTNIVNAFAAPGGYIFVTKGALRKMQDEAELAAVLAHEIAHVTEKHIVKELNIKGTETSAVSGFAQVLGGGSGTAKAVFSQIVDQAAEILFEKGLKKQDEFDADRVSIIITSTAGYDTLAIRRYLKKLSGAGNETKALIDTHPSFEERIKNVDSVLADNQLIDKNYPNVNERFFANVKIN